MATAAKNALKRGIFVLSDQLGECFKFGSVVFKGLISEPEVSDRGTPRGFSFGPEYDFDVEADPAAFTSGIPVDGETITALCNGIRYRIVGVTTVPGATKIRFSVVQPNKK